MRVLVYEHLCTQSDVTSSLRAEGWAMLSAALADLAACAEVEPVTLVEPSLVERVKAISSRIVVQGAAGETEDVFRRLARDCAFALIIAPEFDDILETRCEWAVAAGCRLLGPSPAAVRLCADKLMLANVLRDRGVPSPPTDAYHFATSPSRHYPYVVKPRRGAGSQSTFLVRSRPEYTAAETSALEQGFTDQLIAQRFCYGTPASTALIAGPNRILPLPTAEQHIATNSPLGQMHYAGGAVHYPSDLSYAAQLARCAAESVPGLTGYFGIDLVLNGPDSVVIEINPRLTTSYVGLRRLSNVNLMQVLLDVVQGREPPPLSWRTASLRFDPDGTVHEQGVS